MSRGLSRLQHIILALLERHGPLVTSELVDLLANSFWSSDGPAPRRYRPGLERDMMHTVRRACHSLRARSLVTGQYVRAEHAPNCTVSWSLADGK